MDYYTRVGAYGLVVQEQKILLCRLSSEVLPEWRGCWTLPGGGLEFGESPQEAMVREVEEETGLIVTHRDIVDTNATSGEFEDRRFHSIRIVFTTELIGGELRHETEGTTDRCEWFSPAELKSLSLVELVSDALPFAFPNSN